MSSLLDTRDGRESLMAACALSAEHPDRFAERVRSAREIESVMGTLTPSLRAVKEVNDPTRLAEIIADELQRRNIDARVEYWPASHLPDIVIVQGERDAFLVVNDDMAKSRAELLRLFTLPDGINETTITDVDGDKMLVTWDMVERDGSVVMLEPLHAKSIVLDARGVGELRSALDRASAHAEDPIADPVERAKAVAKELRRRGFYADSDGSSVVRTVRKGFFPCLVATDVNEANYLPAQDGYPASTPLAPFSSLGPSAIADCIQEADARRAQAWAGDELRTALDRASAYAEDPIDDPVERAKAVATELRRRGIRATARDVWVEAVASGVDYDMRFHARVGIGAHLIADGIQAKEAKRAQAWAGDE